MTREEHLLIILAEECAEVTKACAKALRFGLNDGYPGGRTTNAVDITTELADLIALSEMLATEGLIDLPLRIAIDKKKERVEQFLDYSYKVGKLTK